MVHCQPTLGYLSVVHLSGHGWVGGFLVVSILGRPLEFHCTVPVQPNKAQQILYGPTLASLIHGEQIGQALLERVRPDTKVILTDQLETLWAREHARCSLLWARSADQPTTAIRPAGQTQTIGPHAVTAHYGHAEDTGNVDLLAELAEGWDLLEPFQRIRSAIDEAQKAA